MLMVTGLATCPFVTKTSRTSAHLLDFASQRLTESAAISLRLVAACSISYLVCELAPARCHRKHAVVVCYYMAVAAFGPQLYRFRTRLCPIVFCPVCDAPDPGARSKQAAAIKLSRQ